MLIDVVRPEMWEELNDQLRSHLLLPTKMQARGFHGLSQAVFEISQGTAHFMSHKKAIGVVQGQTPAFESLLPYYYKEAYQVQMIPHMQLNSPMEWVQNLAKDTLFVFVAEDHPVTGETYPFVEDLDRLLNEKRILVFRVSHARHFYEALELRPYTVRLCSYSPDHAVAVCGERFRSPSLSAHSMTWNHPEFLSAISRAREGRRQDAGLVTDFEVAVKDIAAPWFKSGASRLMDRAACVLNDVSAEAVLKNLQKKLAIESDNSEQLLSTTNLCHWDAVKMFHHWWLPGPSIEELRGLILISAALLEIKDFAKHFVSAYEEVKQQQSWNP